MTIFAILILIVGAVCEIFVLNAINDDGIDKTNKKNMYGAVSWQILMGILLCWLVDFNIEFYDAGERNFFDYGGEITAEGVMFFLMWLAGAGLIVSGIVNMVRLAVIDLKEGFIDAMPKHQASDAGSKISNAKTPATDASFQQNQIPAWKRVEMEKAAKEKEIEQARKETVAVETSSDLITCPKCGTVQRSNRNCCFACGVRFERSST